MNLLNLGVLMNSRKIYGFISNKKYHNDQNNYYILNLKQKDNKRVVVKGYGVDLKVNDYVEVNGYFMISKHGEEFIATHIVIIKPTKKETILEYLSSGIIKGISKKVAKQIVDIWGDESIDIIDKNPEQLERIPTVGKKVIQKIINSWSEVKPSQASINKIIELGYQHFEAVKIYKRFGVNSLSKVNKTPYIIHVQVPSISFEKVDSVAIQNRFPVDHIDRISACIVYFLRRSHQTGDTLINLEYVIDCAKKYLNIDKNLVLNGLTYCINREYVYYSTVDGVEFIKYKTVKKAQDDISIRLYNIIKNNEHNPSGKKYFLKKIKRKGEKEVPFSDEQNSAIKKSLNSKVSIITGKPGAGKTTAVNELIKQLLNIGKVIVCCAPTGKAAQKMFDSTGLPSSTIHRLLEFNPRGNEFKRNQANPIECDVIIIDESSMVDLFLMEKLIQAINDKTQIIIIGDVKQLPSVGCGALLRDLIDCNMINYSRLEKIYRQAETSKIIINAHKIDEGYFDYNQGGKIDKSVKDFYFYDTNTDEETVCLIDKLMPDLEKEFNIDLKNDLQILTPIHKGKVGTKELNIHMQSKLNIRKENKYWNEEDFEIKKDNYTLRKNDRVIQIVNNYKKEVYNGDAGVILKSTSTGFIIKFDSGREIDYDLSEINELLLSYATTIHKSQGSEYPAVIIVVPHMYNQILDRSLYYTGVTRGKEIVIVIGSSENLRRAIASEKSRNRVTDMKDSLINIWESFAMLY
jgi:exodeoxyribonuclease V alpha subunit